MFAVAKLEAIVHLWCDGCNTKDAMIRQVSISKHGVDVDELPKGWKRHCVFTNKSDEKVYCPLCVAKKFAEEGWADYQTEGYIGLLSEEDTWFDLSEDTPDGEERE